MIPTDLDRIGEESMIIRASNLLVNPRNVADVGRESDLIRESSGRCSRSGGMAMDPPSVLLIG